MRNFSKAYLSAILGLLSFWIIKLDERWTGEVVDWDEMLWAAFCGLVIFIGLVLLDEN